MICHTIYYSCALNHEAFPETPFLLLSITLRIIIVPLQMTIRFLLIFSKVYSGVLVTMDTFRSINFYQLFVHIPLTRTQAILSSLNCNINPV